MLTVCCVQVSNYLGRGAEYVNVLFDMVRRNLPDSFEGRFVCFTDDARGLDEGIETRPVPGDLEGWHNKLYLFKPGVFKDGERVMFLDLDTLITGPLDDVVKYEGDFSTLRDFYRPEGLGPAVMLWRGGYGTEIWREFVYAGKPHLARGDQEWLENYFRSHQDARYPHVVNWTPPQPEILQDIFPGVFVSFKAHCRPNPPRSARVVCFHGEPRPHNAGGEWVPMIWKKGGGSARELATVCNTADEKLAANIRHACSLSVPWLPRMEAHDRHAVIVGGGPSLRETMHELPYWTDNGHAVFATNNTFRFLKAAGVQPEYHVLMDARPENLAFVQRDSGTTYLMASQCDSSLFEAVNGCPIVLMHSNTAGVLDHIPQNRGAVNLLSGGSTVALQAIAAAYCLGYRTFHLYGMDSSFAADHHAYDQPQNDADRVVDCVAGGRKFRSALWMIAQAQEFQELARQLVAAGCVITVHGDGLLPHVAREISTERKAA